MYSASRLIAIRNGLLVSHLCHLLSTVDQCIHMMFTAVWQKIFKFRLCDKVPEGSTLIFGDTLIYPKMCMSLVKGNLHARNYHYLLCRFDTILACERHRDRHRHMTIANTLTSMALHG